MAEDVAGPVDARPLAVPDGEYAIDLRTRIDADLLRSPDGRRGKVFVHAGLKVNVALLKEIPSPPKLLVERAER